MVGKHYQWHRRWETDLVARCASHESGAVVDFAYIGRISPGGSLADLDFVPPEIGCVSLPDDGSAWIGSFRGGRSAAISWLSGQRFNPASQQAGNRLARIMREAGDAWARQKNRAARNAGPNA